MKGRQGGVSPSVLPCSEGREKGRYSGIFNRRFFPNCRRAFAYLAKQSVGRLDGLFLDFPRPLGANLLRHDANKQPCCDEGLDRGLLREIVRVGDPTLEDQHFKILTEPHVEAACIGSEAHIGILADPKIELHLRAVIDLISQRFILATWETK